MNAPQASRRFASLIIPLAVFAAVLAAAWPARAQLPPPVFNLDNCVPPLEKSYKRDPSQLVNAHQRWGDMVFRKPSHKRFSHCGPLPPPQPGPPQSHSFSSTLEGELSLDDGLTFAPVSMTAQTVVQVQYGGTSGSNVFYNSQIVALNAVGPGFILRESPTLQSSGQLAVSAVPGGFYMSSFFNVATELSADGGLTWVPSTNPGGGPLFGRVILTEDVAEPIVVTLAPGYSSIGNNLNNGGNTLAEVIPDALDGTTLFKYDSGTSNFTAHIFDGLFGGWDDPAVTLAPGEGAFIYSPGSQTIIFTGIEGTVPVQPRPPPGRFLVSCPVPRPCDFEEIMGYPPVIGDQVFLYNDTSPNPPVPSSTHFYGPGGWDLPPILEVGKAAFVDLAPVVPPATAAREFLFASNVLPPRNGEYVSPEDYHVAFANGIVLTDPSHLAFTGGVLPPPPGDTQTHEFDSEVRVAISLDNGATTTYVVGNAAVRVQLTDQGDLSGKRQVSTEMLGLRVSGGSLPAGVMVRESPTLPSLGLTTVRAVPNGFMISSTFELNLESSLDDGDTWSPGLAPVRVDLSRIAPENLFRTDTLPPALGEYVSPEDFHAAYANGILLTDPSHQYFTQGLPPPPVGAVQAHTFGSQVRVQISLDGGLTYSEHTANAFVQVMVNHTHDDNGTAFFKTEMQQLSASGGTLPPNVMIRESPTLASRGKTTIRAVPDLGGNMVSSGFDISTEVSTDGGLTWAAAAEPVRMELTSIATEIFFTTPKLPPVAADYMKPSGENQYYANGVIIKEVLHNKFSEQVTPPPLGQSQTHSFNSLVTFSISTDGGVSFSEVSAMADVMVQVTHTLNAGGTQVYETEMMSFNIAGGTLPPGMMIRESPTLASRGRTTIRNTPGGFYISSSFDNQTEMSLDGGQTWAAAQGPAQVQMFNCPELNITHSGNTLLLSWHSSVAGYMLTATESLTTPNWLPVTTAPLLSGDQWLVPINSPATTVFFRLQAEDKMKSEVNLTIYKGQNGPAVPDDKEESLGSFTVANMNDTDGDGTNDNSDMVVKATPKGRDEVDLMKLVLHKPNPDKGGNVKLTVTPASVKLWKKSTKEEEETRREFPTSELDLTLWAEATETSAAIRDITIVMEYRGCKDTVKATAIWAMKTEFKNSGTTAPADANGADINATYTGSGTNLGAAHVSPATCNSMFIEYTVKPPGIGSEPGIVFDVTRQKESDGWNYVGTNVTQAMVAGVVPSTLPAMDEEPNDDAAQTDEDNVPTNDHIYSYDCPGFTGDTAIYDRAVRRFNFNEFVRVFVCGQAFRNNNGLVEASRCSPKDPWRSRLDVVKDAATPAPEKWKRNPVAGENEIEMNHKALGVCPTP